MDFKEKFLSDVKAGLIMNDIEPKDIAIVEQVLITAMQKYDIQQQSTDIICADQSAEQIIKLFVCSKLTEGIAKSTAKAYTRQIRNFYYTIKKPLLDVGTFDIRTYIALRQQSVRDITIENERAYLSSFFQWLTAEQMIPVNPMARIKPIKINKILKKKFSDVEIDALRGSCDTLRKRAELELMLSSGARVSEVASMNIDDIDFANLSVKIVHGKGGKQRLTLLSPVGRKYIMEYLKTRTDSNSALFLTRNGTRITKESIQNDMKSIGEDSGVEKVHPHRCRRTFASNLSKKGVPISVIQKLMGHSNVNTTMTYIDDDEEEVRKYA